MFILRLNPDPSIFEKIQIKLAELSNELHSYRIGMETYTHSDLDRLDQLLFNLELNLLFHKRNPHHAKAQVFKTFVRSFGPEIHALREELNKDMTQSTTGNGMLISSNITKNDNVYTLELKCTHMGNFHTDKVFNKSFFKETYGIPMTGEFDYIHSKFNSNVLSITCESTTEAKIVRKHITESLMRLVNKYRRTHLRNKVAVE